MNTSSRHYDLVAKAIRYIRENASHQPRLAEIANAAGVSEHHLQRLFSEWAGLSPKRFQQYLNKEHALKALKQSQDLLQTSLETGLSGPSRLHDLMISCEAMTPGEIKAEGANLTIRYGTAPTPFGTALIGWTERGVCYLAFLDEDIGIRLQELQSSWRFAGFTEDTPGALGLTRKIFPTSPASGKLHLLLKGTNFQIKVWEALLKTRPGQLVSYGQLAEAIDQPKAQRAVGTAVGANTVGFLIPCHRVIKESGVLGNYRWGTERKAAVQAWEAGRTQLPESLQGDL